MEPETPPDNYTNGKRRYSGAVGGHGHVGCVSLGSLSVFHNAQRQDNKRQKFSNKNQSLKIHDPTNSASSGTGKTRTTKAPFQPIEPIFPKMDGTDPTQARRIQQRRKAIALGKNTLGYVEYTKKVPKQNRRPRSTVTPSTPDHTLVIPNKRWQGLLKSWYVRH